MLEVIKTRNELDAILNKVPKEYSIGLVPTMGNLHDGHLSLLNESTQQNDLSIITIFVNPKQFGPTEDFNQYPRTLDEDIKKIQNLNLKKQVIIFAPLNATEIYGENFTTTISMGAITQQLCGAIRPTHFDGVTTVVYRLFKLSRAHRAYFGQKDFQQCFIIKKMVKDLEIPITLHILPIIRDQKGLALSSRNQYLSKEQYEKALHLPKTLIKIEKAIGENQHFQSIIDEELLNKDWDYLQVLDSDTLEQPTQKTKELVVIGAYRLGSTRLLDNRLVKYNA